MLGVGSSPRPLSLAGPILALACGATACFPLSDLDAAAAGARETASNGTGGSAPATGGESGNGSTGSLGGATGGAPPTGATGGTPPAGGTGGLTSGGRGGVTPHAGQGGDGGGGGVEETGGWGGIEETGGSSGGIGGTGGSSGGIGGTGGAGTGGLQCAGGWQNCDQNPDDCETDTRNDPTHCGGCDVVCPVANDECINAVCVRECTWDSAIPLGPPDEEPGTFVPGNGCVKIVEDLGGNYYLWANREIDFDYEATQCGNVDSGTMGPQTGSAPISSCTLLINLRGTSSQVEIRWWIGG